MRLACVIGILLIVLSQNAIPQENTKSTHPQHQSTEGSNNQEPTGLQIVYIDSACKNANVNETSKAAASQQYSPKWWNRPTITDWILTLITLIYVIVNVCILIAVKHQGRIAEMNTDALINAERAWFDLHMIQSESASTVTIQIINHGRQFGILYDHTVVYARMTQKQFDKLSEKLEREEEDWDAITLSRQTTPDGGILLPNTPTNLETIDLGSFVKQRDDGLIDVFYFRVNYETLSHECYTELVYLVRERPLPFSHFGLLLVPGFTHYE